MSTQDLVDLVGSATTGLDVSLLVVSAGFATAGPFLDGTWADEKAMIEVNCPAVTA